jgi:hypothetical protein
MMQHRARRTIGTPGSLAAVRALGKPGCPLCAGTGWEVVPLRQTSLARRCRCRAEKNREFWTETVGVPARYWWLELRDLVREELIPARTRQQLQIYLRKFPEVPGIVFLVGDGGTNATRLQTAVLKEIWRQRRRRVFYTSCRQPGSEASGELFENLRMKDRESLAEAAELAVFDGWLDSGLGLEQQLRWGEVLRRRFLGRKHSIISCDPWSRKAVMAACEGRNSALPEEIGQLLRNLATDSIWWWLAPPKSRQPASDLTGTHNAVA